MAASRITPRWLPALAVLACAGVPGRDAAAQEPTGRIEGVARIANRLTTTRPRVQVYNEPGAARPAAGADDHRFSGVVLYLEPVPSLARAQPTAPPPAPAMRQHGERFAPRVLPVIVGTTVDFPNDDPIYHNVFSLSRVKSFDLGRYPRGSSKTVRFTAPGVVQVFCHIHADMSGFILVLDNPFFAIPDAQGRFVLDGIPPGDYRLVTWHERIRPMITPVRVESGRATSLRLDIPFVDSVSTRP